MESVLFTVGMLTVLCGFLAVVVWNDNNSMHKAEHEDFFHEHAHK